MKARGMVGFVVWAAVGCSAGQGGSPDGDTDGANTDDTSDGGASGGFVSTLEQAQDFCAVEYGCAPDDWDDEEDCVGTMVVFEADAPSAACWTAQVSLADCLAGLESCDPIDAYWSGETGYPCEVEEQTLLACGEDTVADATTFCALEVDCYPEDHEDEAACVDEYTHHEATYDPPDCWAAERDLTACLATLTDCATLEAYWDGDPDGVEAYPCATEDRAWIDCG